MSFTFGATAPKPAFGGGFGAPASQAPAPPSLFGQQQQPAPALGTATATATATGLFGASAAPASTSLFGAAPAPSTSLFGSSQPPASTSLFASAASAPAAAPSLFGQQPAPSTSLFGAPPPAATTSLFGQPAAQPAAAAGAGLFGAQPAATPLFGQSQLAASTSLFGAPKPTMPMGTGASLFGPPPAASLAQSQQQPVPKLGDPYPPPDPNEPPIEQRIETIRIQWDTSNAACKFQTFFYNVPSFPNTVEQYRQPPPGANEESWRKAVSLNPDPDHLVPALAVGFPALQKRIDAQTSLTASHQSILAEIHAHLVEKSSAHTLKTTVRTLRAQNKAAALSARLVALVARASPLSPNRSTSVGKAEEELRVRVEALREESDAVRGRGNELWAGVGALKARRRDGESMDWAIVDEDGMRQVLEVLGDQQKGLDHLTKTLISAAADVEVIKRAFGLAPAQRRDP